MPDDRLLARFEVGLDLALDLLAGTRAAAAAAGVAVAICVADRAGNAIASARMDGAPLGAFTLAVDKAYTAALWEAPSGDWFEATQPGGVDWGFTSTTGGRIVVYAGGLPILAGGAMVGAIGVSGGTMEQDEEFARAALTGAGLG